MTARRPGLQWSEGAARPVLKNSASAAPRSSSWRKAAKCQEIGPDVFVPDSAGPDDMDGILAACLTCSDCPVRLLCLAYAKSFTNTYGIWGGLFFKEGKIVTLPDRKPGECENGHQMTEANTQPRPGGRRPECRVCLSKRDVARRKAKRSRARDAA